LPKIFNCLKEFISETDKSVFNLTETAIWNYELEDYNLKPPKFIEALKLMLNNQTVGTTYFQTPHRYFKEGDEHIFDGKVLSIYLSFLGYKDESPVQQIKIFIDENEDILSPEIVSNQKILLNLSPDTIVRPKEKAEPDISKWKTNLNNTTWYLYFYGYKHDSEPLDEEEWNIIKLVLKFGKKSKKTENLSVEIKNTPTINHHSYLGKTDFLMSGQKVLIMNLRTVDEHYRHLHIKIHVNNEANGDLFLGQYLNYGHDRDQIWSGSLILEKFKGRHPFPFVYNFKKGVCEEIDEISHLVDFFSDKAMNYRKTTRQVHSQKDFEVWKKNREDSNKKIQQ